MKDFDFPSFNLGGIIGLVIGVAVMTYVINSGATVYDVNEGDYFTVEKVRGNANGWQYKLQHNNFSILYHTQEPRGFSMNDTLRFTGQCK